RQQCALTRRSGRCICQAGSYKTSFPRPFGPPILKYNLTLSSLTYGNFDYNLEDTAWLMGRHPRGMTVLRKKHGKLTCLQIYGCYSFSFDYTKTYVPHYVIIF